MKIEPSQNREGTNEWYGKRGISYHGCAVIFMQVNKHGEYVRTMRYIDTIVEGDAKQDIGSTLTILEDVLLRRLV